MNNKIIVLASYRTGSTALCDVLSKQFKAKNHDEFFHACRNQRGYDTIKLYNYIIKIMPDQVMEPYFSELIKISKIYGIYRKDIVAQIASYFIAMKRNVWHNIKFQDTENYELPYEEQNLETVSKRITDLNETYKNIFRPLCHVEFAYEDIEQSLLKVSNYKVYNKPKNYNDIINSIKKYIK